METILTVGADVLELRGDGDGAHILEGICVPYDTPTWKAGPRAEVFDRGAFASIADAVGRVRLRDGHALEPRPVAVSAAFEERAAGLWGRFRFYRTRQGGDAYDNVKEGTYGGLSVGFHALRDRVVDGVRHIVEARLHHVALVDEPAYDDARILAVRAADPAVEWADLLRGPKVTLDVRQDPDFTTAMARLRR